MKKTNTDRVTIVRYALIGLGALSIIILVVIAELAKEFHH